MLRSDTNHGSPATEQMTYHPELADPTVDNTTGFRAPSYEPPGFFRHRHKKTERRWQWNYRERASNCLYFHCGTQKWCACWPGLGDCNEILDHHPCQETPDKLKDSAWTESSK